MFDFASGIGRHDVFATAVVVPGVEVIADFGRRMSQRYQLASSRTVNVLRPEEWPVQLAATLA